MAPEERDRLVEEFEAQVTVRGIRLLATREIEELLTLLPAAHFRLALRAGIDDLRRRRESFPEKVPEFDEAVSAIAQECRDRLASSDDQEREQFLDRMALLRSVHPALWYRVYKQVAAENLGWALELEPGDREKPFKRP
ncbi:MAG: hypothetical protein HY554_14705 [Elusimicrobia bacterium]|nr:hypothetical protein [Elusimicrobiota bacterium]